MAIEYDSDDIGELDDDMDDAIQGAVNLEQYDKVFNKFLDDHPTSDHVHEAGFAYNTAASDGKCHLQDEQAVAKVSFLHKQMSQSRPTALAKACCCTALFWHETRHNALIEVSSSLKRLQHPP